MNMFIYASCYSQRKVKNSESKSQLQFGFDHIADVVIHSVKLKILKANHNGNVRRRTGWHVVIHSVKLKILKANHNATDAEKAAAVVVIHSVKLKILKANHNTASLN